MESSPEWLERREQKQFPSNGCKVDKEENCSGNIPNIPPALWWACPREVLCKRGETFSFSGETCSVQVRSLRAELLAAKVVCNSSRAGAVWRGRDWVWRKRDWGWKKRLSMAGIWQHAAAIAGANQTEAGDPQHSHTKGSVIPFIPGYNHIHTHRMVWSHLPCSSSLLPEAN